MRRALLVVVLAVPALGAAQAIPPGTVQFVEQGTSDDTVHGRWINATECANQATTSVVMQWTASAAMPAGGSYQIYAANQDAAASGIECPKLSNPSTSVVANPVGVPITGALQTVTNHAETVQAFLTAVGVASCDVAGDVTIHVCVQERDPLGTSIGLAKGMLTLSIAPPGSPSGVSAGPVDDGVLGISWTAPSGDPPAYDFRVVAVAEPPDARDPSVHEGVSDAHALSYPMSGLVNGVSYAIHVYARSEAGNESAPSAIATGTPVAPDATRPVLSRLRGSGQGGCGTGDAGPLALLAVTALLARLRRRAR